MPAESASRPKAKARAPAKRAAGKAESVAAYFAALPPERRAKLQALRKVLKALLPKAEECLSYGIPAFRNEGGVVVYYASMKDHLSFFPTSYPIEACKADLKGYATSRGTVRLPPDAPPPKALLAKLVRVRLQQMAGTPPRMNKAWHAKHPMPKGATLPARAKWHQAHAKACGCRPMPASVAAWLRKS